LPGHKRCRFAEYNSCGHSAGDLEEVTPAGSSVPPIVLNGTNGFSESLCFFEIPVQLLEGSQETGPCHGSSFESKCQFSAWCFTAPQSRPNTILAPFNPLRTGREKLLQRSCGGRDIPCPSYNVAPDVLFINSAGLASQIRSYRHPREFNCLLAFPVRCNGSVPLISKRLIKLLSNVKIC